jgi:hypothetical protein
MKPPYSLVMIAATAILILASAAEAEQRQIGGAPRGLPATHHGGMHGDHGFFVPVFVEQQAPVIIEREVVREVPVVVEAPPPPPPPREPYVIGKSYATLPPSGCMKMIEGAASYYLCSGEWYRQVGSSSAVMYKAVAQP